MEQTSGWPFVRTMAALPVVHSTNEHARALIQDAAFELPLAVWARRQTRGRGRGTNNWWSDAGSLTFTLAIDPKGHGLAARNEPRLALATAVAVIDALQGLGLREPLIGIRWPNDLEVNGRKLGGILPEPVETEHGHRLLIGIGLNVQTDLTRAPESVRSMATSLAALGAGFLDEDALPQVLAAILSHFERVLNRLVHGDCELAARWNRLDLLRDRWVNVDLGTHQVAGSGTGIDGEGALCLDDGTHRFRLFGGQVLRSSSEYTGKRSVRIE
jgi:BirA family transcriptional regulator, biotin operon repressor / biotin---[acetyl-CoA-carboxylase] ligase